MQEHEDILSKLKVIKEPLTQMTVEDLNFQFKLDLNQDTLKLSLIAPYPCSPFKTTLMPLLEAALSQYYPNHKITVSLDYFIKAHRTQLPGLGLKGVKNVIAVGSGKGGVGKSTVSVNLAIALQHLGAKVGILDADIYGPSIPMMLGEHLTPEPLDNQYKPVEAYDIQAMSIGYMTAMDTAIIWRGPMVAKSLIQLFNQTAWQDLDYLIVDLPPGTGDIQLTLIQKIPLAGAVIVSTPQTIATLDAQKAIQLFDKTEVDILGLIENMALHQCEKCGHLEPIFGEGGVSAICETYQKIFLGDLPLEKGIRQGGDEGSPFMTKETSIASMHMRLIALKLGINLSKKPINYADKFPYKIARF